MRRQGTFFKLSTGDQGGAADAKDQEGPAARISLRGMLRLACGNTEMTIRPGDVLETAIWLTGEEPPDLKARFEKDLRASLAHMAEAEGIIIGPLMLTEMRPGEDRVPEVPDYIQGQDVRLLVGETKVIGRPFVNDDSTFATDLDAKDLERLRVILRRVHLSYNPGKPELSTEKCDEYINLNGPQAALDALREQVGVSVH